MSGHRSAAPPRNRALLFDGDCGICTWLARRAVRIDRNCAVLPYQDVPEEWLRSYGITRADCAERIYLLEPWPPRKTGAPTGGAGDHPSGRRANVQRLRARGGAFAVNAFLLRGGAWAILPVVIYLLPPLLLLEIVTYRWVARNRSWISRRLGLEACRWGGRVSR